MRLSAYFLPTIKETPAEAQIVSHRLMLRAGMVRQASAGIYSWLPLGFRVLKNIEGIVRDEQNRAGAQPLDNALKFFDSGRCRGGAGHPGVRAGGVKQVKHDQPLRLMLARSDQENAIKTLNLV